MSFASPAAAAGGACLTRVEQIRALTREQAAEVHPVRLRGTVVYKPRGGRSFILHDGVESVSVHVFRAKELGIWDGGRPPESESDVGAMIEIEGVTGPAGYSPVIVPSRFRRIGTGLLPEPARLPMERLLSGSEVSQRVEVEGVVQRSMAVADGKWIMRLMVEGHPCEVDFQSAEGFDPRQTLDSRVRVRGFCSPVFNLRSEFTRLRLLAWGRDDVTVVEPPPADPFAAPRHPLNGLLRYSKAPGRFHRKVTEGTVNFVLPGRFFFLQDGDTGLLVESAATDLVVGDRLEVAGFVEITRGIASLGEALTRNLGSAPPPAPVAVIVMASAARPRWITAQRAPAPPPRISELRIASRAVKRQPRKNSSQDGSCQSRAWLCQATVIRPAAIPPTRPMLNGGAVVPAANKL